MTDIITFPNYKKLCTAYAKVQDKDTLDQILGCLRVECGFPYCHTKNELPVHCKTCKTRCTFSGLTKHRLKELTKLGITL